MSDQLRSWLRTVVPAAWSALIAWLIAVGAPEWLTSPLGEAQDVIVVPLVLAMVYASLRKLEPHMPPDSRSARLQHPAELPDRRHQQRAAHRRMNRRAPHPSGSPVGCGARSSFLEAVSWSGSIGACRVVRRSTPIGYQQ